MSIILPVSQRLSADTYDRPAKTITEMIQTKKDIEENLKDCEEVSEDDLNFISINTQLKYLSYDKKNKKELFRFGGLVVKIAREYLVLAGKEGKRFSVQRYTRDNNNNIIHKTRFFKRVKAVELLKEQLDQTIEQSTDVIEKQNAIIEKQKKELMALKKKLGVK